MRKSFIYAIQARSGVVKIGISKNPIKRLATLRTGNDDDLLLIACWQGKLADEREAHLALSDFRSSGEWFYPAKPVMAFLRDRDPNFKEPQKVIQSLFYEEVEYWKKKREKAMCVGFTFFIWAIIWRDVVDIVRFWNQW